MFENVNSLKKDFTSKNFIKIITSLSFVFLCAFIFGCALTGAGNYIKIGPLSIRMLVLAVTMILGLPAFFYNFKDNIKKPILWWLLIFIIYLAFSAYKGIKSGVQPNLLSDDIKGFAYLLLLPIAISIIDSKEKVVLIMKTIIISSFILSIASITMNTLIIIDYNYAGIIDTFVREKGFGFFDLITTTITRMFFKSLPYTILASMFSFYFLMKRKKINWLYVMNIVFSMWAIIFSYTRSIIAVTAIVAILFVAVILVINIKDYKKLLKNIGAVLAVFIVVSLAICIPVKTNYIKYAMNRVFVTFDETTVDDANNSKINVVTTRVSGENNNVKTLSTVKQSPKTTEPTVSLLAEDNTSNKPDGHEYLDKTKNQGDTYRAETIRQQRERIKESPVFGLGLGSRIQLREHVENTHLDMIMKMGYIGFILYYLPIVYMLYLLIKEIYIDKKKKTMNTDKLNILAITFLSILTFVILTYFNPYMNASLGISIYAITITIFTNRKSIFREGKEVKE